MKTTIVKHTEGPWIHERNGIIVSTQSSGKILATVNQITNNEDECLANAKLIAESPNLLDSCHEYKNLLEMIIGDDELWDLMEKKNIAFAAKASLKMDLERVTKRIKRTL